ILTGGLLGIEWWCGRLSSGCQGLAAPRGRPLDKRPRLPCQSQTRRPANGDGGAAKTLGAGARGSRGICARALPLQAGLFARRDQIVAAPFAVVVDDDRLEALESSFADGSERRLLHAILADPLAPAGLVRSIDAAAGIRRADQRALELEVVHLDDSRTAHAHSRLSLRMPEARGPDVRGTDKRANGNMQVFEYRAIRAGYASRTGSSIQAR